LSARGQKGDLTASKYRFRSTPEPDITDKAGHVGFVPISEVASF
jgi:hypothetical protein